jgi:hypothetical protein
VPHVIVPLLPGMVAHVCVPSTQELKQEDLGFEASLAIYQVNLGYT